MDVPPTPGRDLAARWVATWTHTRDLTTTTVDGWPLVHVCSPSRETELICTEPGTGAFEVLLRHVDGDPRAMLTVIAADIEPYAAVALPAGVRVDREDECLMTTDLFPVDAPPPAPADLTVRWEVAAASRTLVIEAGDRVAAEGTVGVLGTVATFDRIETSPSFRRRGLGGRVVSELTSAALQQGARTGVLTASADGRSLYEALGWTTTAGMLSLMGREPA